MNNENHVVQLSVERMARMEQIAALAIKCRSAQKAYFRSRHHEDLDTAKSLERQLDDALKELTNPSKVPTLF